MPVAVPYMIELVKLLSFIAKAIFPRTVIEKAALLKS